MTWEERMADRAAKRESDRKKSAQKEHEVQKAEEWNSRISEDEYVGHLSEYIVKSGIKNVAPWGCACMGCPLHVATDKCYCELSVLAYKKAGVWSEEV